ncbi:MAG: Lrp/AsnC family transcriptional regulator [Candidatus Poseidoniales archaeon]|jgi:Lrp/AsnC family transcriptional regulator for asnA, asnC and gidA|tara:strand:+ start:1346 stop:1819 length:474 start_codon:yes stop_codon:yes gene_type:complete
MSGTLVDETDKKIIQVLCEDARSSLRKISRLIGVSLGAVSNRVKKLEERGVIKGYSVLLDHEKIGWELNVVIGLRIQKGRLIEIQEKIAKDNRIYGAYDVTGDFDSMILARATNREDLDNLSKNVLSIEGVERSVTHLVLNTVKEIPSAIPQNKDIK